MIQNFEIPAGNSEDINIDVGPDTDGYSLLGKTLVFEAWATRFGLPIGDVVLKKTTDYGIVVDDATTLEFHVEFRYADTKDLLGNHYYEVSIVDAEENRNTVTSGIMTVTNTPTTDVSLGSIP